MTHLRVAAQVLLQRAQPVQRPRRPVAPAPLRCSTGTLHAQGQRMQAGAGRVQQRPLTHVNEPAPRRGCSEGREHGTQGTHSTSESSPTEARTQAGAVWPTA